MQVLKNVIPTQGLLSENLKGEKSWHLPKRCVKIKIQKVFLIKVIFVTKPTAIHWQLQFLAKVIPRNNDVIKGSHTCFRRSLTSSTNAVPKFAVR